jgi:ketosteroid isomerase-like protein
VSQEDVELLQEALAALDENGVDAVLPYIHPDFEFSTPPSISLEPETYNGHDGLRRYFDQWYDAADRVRVLPDEFFDAGDRVVVAIRLVARGLETGIESELRAAMVWHVRGRQAVGLEIFPTLDEAREAAGLGT